MPINQLYRSLQNLLVQLRPKERQTRVLATSAGSWRVSSFLVRLI